MILGEICVLFLVICCSQMDLSPKSWWLFCFLCNCLLFPNGCDSRILFLFKNMFCSQMDLSPVRPVPIGESYDILGVACLVTA